MKLSKLFILVCGLMPLLTCVLVSNSTFAIGFTNTPGMSFTVWMTTNLALPLTNWTALGAPSNIVSGQYEFSDPSVANGGSRYYRVTLP